jgi:hypothetical protein
MRTGVLVALLLTGRAAQAQPDQLREGPWYGWQVVLTDAAAIALLAMPVSTEAGPVTRGLGMTAFLMNGPVVHMSNGNPRSASISLMRLPLLLLGRLAGTTAGGLLCKTVACTDTATLLGTGVAVMPVVLHDWWTAQRPPRSYYAVAERPRPPPVRLEGWRPTLPLLGGTF